MYIKSVGYRKTDSIIINGILYQRIFKIRRMLKTLRDQELRAGALVWWQDKLLNTESNSENSVQASDVNNVMVSDRKRWARGDIVRNALDSDRQEIRYA